jgi:hypothetical protein
VPDVDKKRPLAILVLCALAVLITVLIGASVPFMLQARTFSGWLLAWFGVATVIGLSSLWGYFQMRRWGVRLYALLTLANQIILWRMHSWSADKMILPAIVLSIGLAYWRDMD